MAKLDFPAMGGLLAVRSLLAFPATNPLRLSRDCSISKTPILSE
jgi:hypothetical protein